MALNYIVKMYCFNGYTQFETNNPKWVLKHFRKRTQIEFTQPNGMHFIHDTKKYYSIEIKRLNKKVQSKEKQLEEIFNSFITDDEKLEKIKLLIN